MAVSNIFQSYLQAPKSVADYTAEMDVQDLRRAQMENAQRQNALAALQFGAQQEDLARQRKAQNALEAIYSDPANAEPQALESALMRNPLTMDRGAALRKGRLELAETEAKTGEAKARTGKIEGETMDAALSRYRKGLDSVRDRPAAVRWITAQYNDPQVSKFVSSFGTLDQAIAEIPQDPAQFGQWVQQNAMGMEAYLKIRETERNNRAQVAATTRGQDVSAATSRANNAASVAATIRGQNLADARQREQMAAKPPAADGGALEYVQTEAGLVALPKKVAPGQTPTPIVVTGAAGEKLGKPLKDIPANVNTAIIANAQGLGRVERALALAEGKDVQLAGGGIMKGDKSATGLKGYLPNTLLNRVDPRGVDLRSEIADLGSMVIHDRSGAAVTASEFPRLQPFIPSDKDDAPTVKKKLRRFREIIAEEADALQATYSREQGYRPNPVKPARPNVVGDNAPAPQPRPQAPAPAPASSGRPSVSNW